MALLTMAHVAARQQTPDTREALAAFWNQRITVQAVFQRFGYTQHGRKVVIIEQVTYQGAEVAQHVWIPLNKAMKALHLKPGNVIQLEARVMRYIKNNPHIFHYGLDDIAAPIVLRRK